MARVLGKPVGPRAVDARAYRKVLRELVDVPVLRGVTAGLDLATETLAALQSGQSIAFQNVMDKLTVEGRERLDEFFNGLSGSHEKRFVQAHRRALGVSALQALLSDTQVRVAMEAATSENVNLIRLIAKKHLPKVFGQVADLYGSKPFDRQALAKLFSDQWGYRDYPLRRIARDQVNKSVGSLNRIRQQQIGVSKYEWASAGDNRVRLRHSQNDGQTFSWNDPPLGTGHPGHEIQCRCVALAVLDDVIAKDDSLDPAGAGISGQGSGGSGPVLAPHQLSADEQLDWLRSRRAELADQVDAETASLVRQHDELRKELGLMNNGYHDVQKELNSLLYEIAAHKKFDPQNRLGELVVRKHELMESARSLRKSLADEMRALKAQIAEKSDVNKMVMDEFRERLLRPVGQEAEIPAWKIEFKGRFNQARRDVFEREITELMSEYTRLIPDWPAGAGGDPFTIRVVNAGHVRANATGWGGRRVEIAAKDLEKYGGRLDSTDFRRILAHEVEHIREYDSIARTGSAPGVKLLERRVNADQSKNQWMGPGYARDEKTRKDKFVSNYMGKDYSNPRPYTNTETAEIHFWDGGVRYTNATELQSMGIGDTFFSGRFGDLVETDPDYLRWILTDLLGLQ